MRPKGLVSWAPLIAVSLAVMPLQLPAQNCSGDAQSQAVCKQQQDYQRAKEELERNQKSRVDDESMRRQNDAVPVAPAGPATIFMDSPEVQRAKAAAAQAQLGPLWDYTYTTSGIEHLRTVIYDADPSRYEDSFHLDTFRTANKYVQRLLPQPSRTGNDGLSNLQLAEFGALAGLARWDKGEYEQASGRSSEWARRQAVQLLQTCLQWTGAADCKRILMELARQPAAMLPPELSMTAPQISAAPVAVGELLDWNRLGSLDLRWQRIRATGAAEKKAADERAAEAASRAQLLRRMEAPTQADLTTILGIATLDALPATRHAALIASGLERAQQLAAASGASLGLRTARPVSELRPLISEVRTAIAPLQAQWAAQAAAGQGNAYAIAAQELRETLASGCTPEQPTNCDKLALWVSVNQSSELLQRGALVLSEAACHENPARNFRACRFVGESRMRKSWNDAANGAKALGHLVMACEAEIASKDRFASGCLSTAQCLSDTRCGGVDIPMAVAFLQLACAGSKWECGTKNLPNIPRWIVESSRAMQAAQAMGAGSSP